MLDSVFFIHLFLLNGPELTPTMFPNASPVQGFESRLPTETSVKQCGNANLLLMIYMCYKACIFVHDMPPSFCSPVGHIGWFFNSLHVFWNRSCPGW